MGVEKEEEVEREGEVEEVEEVEEEKPKEEEEEEEEGDEVEPLPPHKLGRTTDNLGPTLPPRPGEGCAASPQGGRPWPPHGLYRPVQNMEVQHCMPCYFRPDLEMRHLFSQI